MAKLAIATKPINAGRFSVKKGEPLPPKYQLQQVWDWIKKQFGNDSIEVIHSRSEQQLYSLAYERQLKMLSEENEALKLENIELKSKLKNPKPGSVSGKE